MKNKSLLICLLALFVSTLAQSQYSIADSDGNPINDGDVIIKGSTAEADALSFFVTNETDATLRSTIEYVSTDEPGGFQLCYGGQCYDPITTGNSYPPVTSPQIINAGATTGQGNKMFYNEVDNPVLSNHVFRFYLVDEDGNDIGSDLTITYRYDPALGLDDVQSQLGITVASTVVGNSIALTSTEEATMQVYDINGRLMQTNSVIAGTQQINLSGLSSQLYLISFEGANGNKQTIKILKK